MTKEKKSFAELLRRYGYAMPESEEDVERFENKFKSSFESPESWSTVEEILAKKNSEIKNIVDNPVPSENRSATNLSMAAREGKEISDDIKRKMKEDRKNAKK
jgi:hypothetical protein